MKIFITGASGFVGSNLLHKLSMNNSIQLFPLFRKRFNEKFTKINVYPVYGSLSNLETINFNNNCDVFIHIAGLTKTCHYKNFYKTNTKGTYEAIKFAKKIKVKHFILISSLAAFGPVKTTTPVKETDAPRPVSHYGRSKLLAEKIVIKSGLPYTIIRPPAIFGEGDRDIFLYFKMVKNGIVFTSGNLKRLYSLIYIQDLVNFIIKVILNEKAINESFFVGYHNFFTMNDIIEFIEKSFNKKAIKINLPSFFTNIVCYLSHFYCLFSSKSPILNLDKLHELNAENWICSTKKANDLLSFSPDMEIENAIKETSKWYLENKLL